MRRSLTYEKCREEVSKYNSYTELNQTDPSVINKIFQSIINFKN